MRTLKGVLVDIQSSWADAGAGIDVKDALLKHRNRDFWLLITFGILMTASFGVMVWLAATDRTGAVKTLGKFAGFPCGGFLAALLWAWKDWSRTDLLLILVDQASRAQVAAIIDKLIQKL